VLKPPEAQYVQHDSTIDQISSRPELFALTGYLSVELPGIESADNSVDLREQIRVNTARLGCLRVLTSIQLTHVNTRLLEDVFDEVWRHAAELLARRGKVPQVLSRHGRYSTFAARIHRRQINALLCQSR
jgi:glutamate/tyrosine decarboxylase-like PLP-dependent enzyme